MHLAEFLESGSAEEPFAAVLGYPVSHSRSPLLHNASLTYHKIPVTYHAVACPAEQTALLPRLFSAPGFRGANITIPLKEKVVPFLDVLDETARPIGAVNTVVPDSLNGSLTGYNTDVYGFTKPLESFGVFETAVILGTGGAARAAIHALAGRGCRHIYVVSRTAGRHDLADLFGDRVLHITYDQLEDAIRKSDLLVNTTPSGMHPDMAQTPVSEQLIPMLEGKVCYDIIYNPPETRLLQLAERHGARVIGGLDMFLHQAARSFELWFGKSMPLDLVREKVLESLDFTRSES